MHQHHAGEGLVEFLPVTRCAPRCRIVEIDAPAAEAFHDEKMVKVPEDDDRRAQRLYRGASPC